MERMVNREQMADAAVCLAMIVLLKVSGNAAQYVEHFSELKGWFGMNVSMLLGLVRQVVGSIVAEKPFGGFDLQRLQDQRPLMLNHWHGVWSRAVSSQHVSPDLLGCMFFFSYLFGLIPWQSLSGSKTPAARTASFSFF